MSSKLVPIDFEFVAIPEFNLKLVCCSFTADGEKYEYWLLNKPEEKKALKNHILALRDNGYIFLAYNVIAEAQCFITLGINPAKCKWIDLQQEWKMLVNHYHKYMYGNQLIEGKEVTTVAPKYGTEKTVNNSRPPKNLAGCIYKLLDIKIDTDHKTKMRDIIIANDEENILANKKDIQDYCTSDIIYLVDGWKKIRSIYVDFFKISYKFTTQRMRELRLKFNETNANNVKPEEVLWRGETAARTAMMQAVGYPVNVPRVKKFIENVPKILNELCEDINAQFPEDQRFFKWNNKNQRYSMFQKPIKEWISSSEYSETWLRTAPSATKPEGDFSLSLEAWEKKFSYRHDYPTGVLPAQVLRFLKTRQSLNGFLPKSKNAKNKETFLDSLGSDGRVRSYLNPYGAQSARFQPKATGFIPLKASWMRSLIEPPKGKALCGMDYVSQEFLIAALLASREIWVDKTDESYFIYGDDNMIKAYESGDVYLYFAKLAGAVPWEGTKKEYPNERNVFKSTTLGISYSMGAAALARKLTDDTGKPHTKDDAQKLINKFMSAYPTYATFIQNIRFSYKTRNYHKLPDGWVMFGDNDNERSVSNVPIQGFGSCILRKAIQLCQDKGLKVIFPLHDALYIEYDSNDKQAVLTMAECMREAFAFYFEGDLKQRALDLIRLDLNVWSPDYEDGVMEFGEYKAKCQKIYIDDRSEKEYNRFKKYMEA